MDAIHGGSRPLRVLVVDDHALTRQGICFFLQSDPLLTVVGEAADVRGALSEAQRLQPDVLFLDMMLPDGNGLDVLRSLPGGARRPAVVVVTSMDEPAAATEALRLGALGYLFKDSHPADLRSAAHQAHRGSVYLAPGVAMRLALQTEIPRHDLTAREVDVLRLVAAGHNNREIAEKLVVAEKTVKGHLGNLFGKLRLQNRTQLAMHALQLGIQPAAPKSRNAPLVQQSA